MGEHAYVSTACQHQLHRQCRRTCKFCPAGCGCVCHGTGERSPARCAASAGSLLAGHDHVHRCSWPTGGQHVHRCECGADWTEITLTEHDRIQDQLSRVDPYDSTKGGVTGG